MILCQHYECARRRCDNLIVHMMDLILGRGYFVSSWLVDSLKSWKRQRVLLSFRSRAARSIN